MTILTAIGIFVICSAIAFGAVKLLDWLYKIWASGGMNGM